VVKEMMVARLVEVTILVVAVEKVVLVCQAVKLVLVVQVHPLVMQTIMVQHELVVVAVERQEKVGLQAVVALEKVGVVTHHPIHQALVLNLQLVLVEVAEEMSQVFTLVLMVAAV
jgi:hypothetical protein